MSAEGDKQPEAAAAAAAEDIVDDDDHEEDDDDDDDDEEDLEKLQAEIARMEAEAARISQENEQLEKGESGSNKPEEDAAAKQEAAAAAAAKDKCSIYVGQVDYAATPEALLGHFEACGTVERVTIVCDKYTGKPKGFAYLEFENEAAVENAMKLDGSEFMGRTLKITQKRVNQPGYHFQQQQQDATRGGRAPAGRGRGAFRGRGRGFRGRGAFRGRGGFRGARGGGYHPYY